MYAEAELISDAIKHKGLNTARQGSTNLDDFAKSSNSNKPVKWRPGDH